jgi:hypothetical protein
MASMVKLSTGLLTAFVISTVAGPALAKRTFDCHMKGKHGMVGQCKELGRGMCSFTADMSTVKLRCKDVRRG